MKKEHIDMLIITSQLRIRHTDTERIKSIIKSAEINAAVVKNIPLTDDSATVVFREMYESIRQLGDAQWWFLGFEALNHEVSLKILQEMNTRDRVKLNYLTRFKKIRNDINYRGFRASVLQANEITDFWNSCGRRL